MNPITNIKYKFDDIQVKSLEQEGLNAHDFGQGWASQRRRMQAEPWLSSAMVSPDSISTGASLLEDANPRTMQHLLHCLFNKKMAAVSDMINTHHCRRHLHIQCSHFLVILYA